MGIKKTYSQAARVQGILKKGREESRVRCKGNLVDDLIVYLDYKIREGKRVRNERKS
jgi:hypothetical protein